MSNRVNQIIDKATTKITIMRISNAYMAGLVDKEYVDSMAENSKSITGYDIRRSTEKK